MKKRIPQYIIIAITIYLLQAYMFNSLNIADFSEPARAWAGLILGIIILVREFILFIEDL